MIAAMQRQRYSDEQKAEALRLVVDVGPAEAGRRTGIPAGTIASWATRAGVTGERHTVATKAATEQRVATIAERKARLAEALMGDLERMRRDLFAPTVERKAMAAGQTREVEIVTINHPTTTHAERRTAIEAIAKAVETVQLLTGGATARTEQLTAKQAAIEEARERGLRLVS